MTTEFILLVALYAFILIGVFLGEKGPIATFQISGPRLAGKIERDISNGHYAQPTRDGFQKNKSGASAIIWQNPDKGGP